MRILNVIGPINNLSYGNICCNLVDNLVKQGVKVCLKPIGGINYIDDHLVKSVKTSLENPQDEISSNLIIWHHNQLSQFKKENCLNIGFPIFEIDKFDENDVKNLNGMNNIFVTCNWYAKILKNYTDRPIDIVNLGVNEKLFNGKISKKKNYFNDERLTFINIGKWEIRKGHDVLPIILKKALNQFPVKTRLVLLTFNRFISNQDHLDWENYYNKELKGCGIEVIINRVKEHSQVAEIMAASDIGLFPSRAEGWNMGLHEMLSLGKTCLVNNFSAHTEYCTSQNSILIGDNGNLEIEDCFDGQWFFGKGSWVKYTDNLIDKWVEAVRRVVYEDFRIKQEIVVDSVKHLTWENSAKQIIKNIWQNF